MQEMKKCPHCGAIQQPSRQTCIDCGRVLPEAHSEFARELDRLSDEKLAGRLDADYSGSIFYKSRIVFIVLGVILALANIVLILLLGDDYQVGWHFIAILCGAAVILTALFPKAAIRYFNRGRYVPPEVDYVSDSERVALFLNCVALLIAGIALSVYFSLNPERIVRGFTVTDTMSLT